MLDILSDKGQATLSDVDDAVAIWESHHDGCHYIRTPEHLPSTIDAVLVRDGVVEGIAEMKCRYDVNREQFNTKYKGTWLVTMEKIGKAAKVSAELRVPLYGFLYLVQDRTLLTVQITDASGEFCVPMTVEETETQATINGGVALRKNAFIDMIDAREWRQGCLGSSTKPAV